MSMSISRSVTHAFSQPSDYQFWQQDSHSQESCVSSYNTDNTQYGWLPSASYYYNYDQSNQYGYSHDFPQQSQYQQQFTCGYTYQ